MKRFLVVLTFAAGATLAHAGGGLDGFLADINLKAKADLPGFSTTVSAQFGLPVVKVDAVLKGVPSPADAFMILHLSAISGRPPEVVLNAYKSHGGKGWGELAKSLGIKPGSAEFHALKDGNLHYGARGGNGHGDSHGGSGKSHGPAKDGGKEKHGKGKEKHGK